MTVCCIHLITLEIDPLTYQDEVQIVDYGRVILNPSSDWALTWYVQGDHPVIPFSYLGKLMQEVAFRITAPSGLGPRYLAMIGAVLAATCALGWLIVRNTPPIIALVLAFVFLVDPIFSDIYRGGRIDGWAIAACLGSCWLLRVAHTRAVAGRPLIAQAFAAGALLSVSLFLWSSAAMLVPLVLLEFYYLARSISQSQTSACESSWIKAAFYFVIGGGIALVILFIPIVLNLNVYLSSARSIFELQKFSAVIQHSIIDLFMVYDPFLFFAAVVAFAIRREAGMLIAFFFALMLAYQTAIYLARVLYFVPYLLAIIGFTCSNLLNGSYHRYVNFSLQSLLVLLVGWNVSQVLVIRTAIAEAQRPANEPQQLLSALKEAIGPGSYRVLLLEWQAYYAARALGWNMYISSNRLSGEEYIKFMSTMDYVILRDKPMTRATSARLEPAGFELKSSISFASPKKSEIGWWRFKLNVPQRTYPTINIYHKKQPR